MRLSELRRHAGFVQRRIWPAAFVAACAMAVGNVGGCASDRSVISQANQVHDGLKPAVMEGPELSSHLQSVGDRIIASARKLDAKDYGPDTHRSEDTKWMFSPNMKFHFV